MMREAACQVPSAKDAMISYAMRTRNSQEVHFFSRNDDRMTDGKYRIHDTWYLKL